MSRPFQPTWIGDAAVPDDAAGVGEERWRAVFAALAGGTVRALDELYDLAGADVYRLALWRTDSAEDAEDVVQDVFVKVAERCRELGSVRRPRAWLLTVAHRCAIDLVRRRERRRAEPVDATPFLEATDSDPDRELEAGRVSRAVGRLPAKQREVILLRHFAGCTFSEIGRITGVPIFTAASRHRLAIARLRRLLEGE
ncbi:MAG: sigma-70 family RNA polymerase sigma factor [Thermoanaerobaculales bacterium]|nr:sigma-70 family RNA polymerase sigma factor [Thermoanaerobaculales bacterium]